jgi:hypothetical protein
MVEVREYLVLKHDGTTEHFPVRDGDLEQAQLRVALCRHPGDSVVAVTDEAYVIVRSDLPVARRRARQGGLRWSPSAERASSESL